MTSRPDGYRERTRLLALSRWLSARSGEATVALTREGPVSADRLAESARALAAALAATGSGAYLLHTESALAAAAALLALAETGSFALLPPNAQPDTLRRSAALARGALLDPDAPAALPEGVSRIAPLAPPPAPPAPRGARRDPDARIALLSTSGTTGDGKPVEKALRHLEEEVETLEALFGARLPATARCFATVGHQHIYGLLFRVLWPLASGRPFEDATPLHAQELLARMREAEHSLLVTTPASLRRIAYGDELRALRGRCHAVFSSGGPLDPDTAKRVADLLGDAPFEILGSTETGGIAVRQRSVHGETFWPFPGVTLACEADDGRLVVTSRLCSAGEPAGGGRMRFVTGDRARLRADGGFELEGRADRSVKIGEKRVSLPAMERDLSEHACVDEAALLVLEQGRQARIHAVVSLTPAGQRLLAEGGRRALSEALGAHLARRWDRVLLPRAYRCVDALPRNAEGKLPQEALRALFEQRGREPEKLAEVRGERSIEQRLRVPADLAHLAGHFPGFPIVPGVAQLGFALAAAEELLGEEPRVRRVEALKFPTPLRPGDVFTLRVELSPEQDRLRFRAAEGTRIFASGRCLLAAGEVR